MLVATLFTSLILPANPQLRELIEEALRNSPEIRMYESRYSRALEKVNEARWLPDARITLGYFASKPETRTGAQNAKVGVMQTMPWFGSIPVRKNYQGLLADSRQLDVEIAKRKLIASVSKSYYRLHAVRERQEIYAQNIELLEIYLNLSMSSLESGNASAVDVLRIQMSRNELIQSENTSRQDYLAEQSGLNRLLNREESVAIETTFELNVPQSDEVPSGMVLGQHPELLKFDKLSESVELLERLNQKEKAPSMGFGFDYAAVSARPGLDFDDNGKDIVMAMVSLSVPIFSGKHTSRSLQNEWKRNELTSGKQGHLNILRSQLEQAVHYRASSAIQYNTNIAILQLVEDAQEILTKGYETGTIDFGELLELQQLQLKLQLSQIDSVLDYYVHSTTVDYHTGY